MTHDPILLEMKAVLEGQMKKEQFWKTDAAMLEKLGRLIYGLDKIKEDMMANMMAMEEDY